MRKQAVLKLLANGDEMACGTIAKAIRGIPGPTLDVILTGLETGGLIQGTPNARNKPRFLFNH